ncbi:hypothetical protein EB796_002468 [Bugula neritina]|uniref:Uncharacterized protein n=1 Tax=Bugula neritina TaxID=10212 RepID=A0A7J7KM40_BUGNE|nr:hypothetical protein EB796_002468 [Bugula neritina]
MTTTIPDMAWRCSLDMHMKEDNSKLEDLGLNILTPQTLLNLTRTVFNKYATKSEDKGQINPVKTPQRIIKLKNKRVR